MGYALIRYRCPLSSLGKVRFLPPGCWIHLKSHPALRPLLHGSETLEYGAHLAPEGGLHGMPAQYAGRLKLLVGDALRAWSAGFTVLGWTALIDSPGGGASVNPWPVGTARLKICSR